MIHLAQSTQIHSMSKIIINNTTRKVGGIKVQDTERLSKVKASCEEVNKLVELMITCLKANAIDEMYKVLVVMTHKMDELIEEILQVQPLLEQEIEVKEINDALGESIDSIQNKDYGLLMDLLQYEILEKVDEWKSVIEEAM